MTPADLEILVQHCPEPVFGADRFVTVTFCPNPEVREVSGDGRVTPQVTGDVIGQVTPEVTGQVTGEVGLEIRLLQVMSGEMARLDIQEALGLKHEDHFRKAQPGIAGTKCRLTEKSSSFCRRLHG